MSEQDILNLFEQREALLSGHFLLTSGLHSDRYLQCALVLQHPDLAGRIGSAIAAMFSDADVNSVIGPAIGGIVIAQEVARALGVRAMFSEREAGTMTLRRGFAIGEGERVLIVEDIITTGGSVQEVIDCVSRMGAKIVGVGVIIDRSGGRAAFDVPFRSLARLQVSTYTEDECPLCNQGTEPYKPGSRQT